MWFHGCSSPLAPLRFHTLTLVLIRIRYLPIMRVMHPDGVTEAKRRLVLNGAFSKACELARDGCHALGWQWERKSNQVLGIFFSRKWMQDKRCMHQFGGIITHLHFTEGVSHFLVFHLFHKISHCSFWLCFYFFLFTLLCSFLLFFC